MATEEMIRKGQGLLAKINFAKQRVKDFMNSETFCKNPVKQDYYAAKVKEWTLKLDALRKELKDL